MTLPDTAALRLGEREIVLHLRRSARARRVALRIDPSSFAIELVLPARASLGEALRFAARQTDWIERRLAKLPTRIDLADGSIVPLLGVPHRLRHLPGELSGRCGARPSRIPASSRVRGPSS